MKYKKLEEELILEVKNLGYSYSNRRIFENLNFDIAKGKHIAIIGDNGSGKTTLIKVILGMLPGYDGNIKLFNTPLEKFRHWDQIGYVAQNNPKHIREIPISVKEVLRSAKYNKNIESTQEAVNRVMSVTGIIDLQDRLISELSGGQIQRTIIARSLVNRPKILILDEPTTGIDPETRFNFFELIHKLKTNESMTIIQITHDLDRILDQVDETLCIQNNPCYQHKKNLFHIHK